MSDGSPSNKSFDVALVSQNLQSLHEFVTRTKGRLEVSRPGSEERCVLISKEELESLERALEILSNTEEVRDMSGKIAELAAATGPVVAV